MCSGGRSKMAALTRSKSTPRPVSVLLTKLLAWLEPPSTTIFVVQPFISPPSLSSQHLSAISDLFLITLASLSRHSRQPSRRARNFDSGERTTATFETVAKGDRRRETRSAPASERVSASFSVAISSERRKMAKRKGSSAPSCSRARKKVDNDATDVESAQHLLEKLPQEVWEKILDEVKDEDLFPLALSCRYFRQKQKELVARSRQSGPGSGKPRLSLKTNLYRKFEDDQPASVEYLRFCSKEKVSRDAGQKKAKCIRRCTAFHGHLPLLKELLEPANELDKKITRAAGESPSSHSLLRRRCLLCFDF